MPTISDDRQDSVCLDTEKMCVLRAGEAFPLSKKAYALLAALRDNPHRLMSQDDLLDRVWPKTYVQPEIIKTYIKEIRRALGDDAGRARFIETRRGCGYMFVGSLPTKGAPSSRKFVGRESEIAILQSILRSSAQGKRGFAFITGESGIGKSALLNEAEARVRQATDLKILRGNCQPDMHPRQAFYPFLEILSSLSGLAKEADAAPVHEPALSSRGGAVALTWSMYDWCEFLEKASQNTPLLLIIEDIQWADKGTLALLGAMARRKAPAKLSIFSTYRAVNIESNVDFARACMIDLLLHCDAVQIALSGFSQEEVFSYVERHVRQPVARERELVISSQSGGNPFLVQAMMENMLQSSAAETAAAPDGTRFPSHAGRRVEYMLEAQLSQLGPRVSRIIEAASISGKFFCSWSVSQLLECDIGYVEELCGKLVQSDQLLENFGHYTLPDGTVSPRFKFKHELFHEMLVRKQSRARLASLQRRLGIRIEKFWGRDVKLVASDITHRFELAGDWPRALSYAKIAAVESRSHADVADTMRFANKALQLTEFLPPEQREREVKIIGHEFGLN